MKDRTSILFVCMANICRSPALEATFRHLAIQKGVEDRFFVDSCGIGWSRLGQRPDPRLFEVAKQRGILIDHRAQQFQDEYFVVFDRIFVVDLILFEQLKFRAKSPEEASKIALATAFSQKFKGEPIADPYYMSPTGFHEIMDIIIDSCEGLLRQCLKELGL